MRDGFNRVEAKGKEMFYMEAVVKDMNVVEDRTAGPEERSKRRTCFIKRPDASGNIGADTSGR